MAKRPCEWGDFYGARARDFADARSAIVTSQLDSIILVETGSVFSRTLQQYRTILTHNGAPDILSGARCIVDANCGGGIALIGLRQELGGKAHLIGVDVRNVTLWKSTRRGESQQTKVADLFDENQIDFRQGSFSDMKKLVPEGYDALVTIPSFFSEDWKTSFPLEVLREFFEGLHQGGMVQALISPPPHLLSRIEACLTEFGIPFMFTPGDTQVLAQNGFKDNNGVIGTLTLGPKR